MSVNSKSDSFSACLPDEIKPEMLVTLEPNPETTPANNAKPKPVTVRQRLIQLKAHCKDGKLLDGQGKEIRFVQLIGCWGNPPEDYQEQLNQQQAEIKRLKEKYIVVQISCAQDRDVKLIN
ncbi:MAG TPA: hypothetical protein VFH91_09050 [Pyrinomonadaceae bacterium]|nr:hypothetical protein [Pyrinomonadaceae bacterium]